MYGVACISRSVDSSDIVDHKLKLILGLIWTLILHYSISMPVWDNEDDVDAAAASAGTVSNQNQTPKQRLLAWIQNKIPDRPITNFTSAWSDGRAIGALVDGVAPGQFLVFSANQGRRFPPELGRVHSHFPFPFLLPCPFIPFPLPLPSPFCLPSSFPSLSPFLSLSPSAIFSSLLPFLTTTLQIHN